MSADLVRRADRCNVGRPNDVELHASYASPELDRVAEANVPVGLRGHPTHVRMSNLGTAHYGAMKPT